MSGVPEERGRMHDFRLRLGQSLLLPSDPTRNLGPAISVSMILNSGSKTTSKMKHWIPHVLIWSSRGGDEFFLPA